MFAAVLQLHGLVVLLLGIGTAVYTMETLGGYALVAVASAWLACLQFMALGLIVDRLPERSSEAKAARSRIDYRFKAGRSG